jgi:hypothetical protein
MVDNGLIFEFNRRILHPLGLALEVDVDYKNKRQVHISALVETEDEDGFIYDEEGFESGSEKYQKFVQKREERLQARKEKYKFIEQDKGL